MRVAKAISLTDEDRVTLTKWSRGRSTPARLVQRASIILGAAGHYIDHHNANPKTFVWTKKAEDILEKVARARKALNKSPSE